MNLFLDLIFPIILLLLVSLAVIFRRIGKLEIPAWTAFMTAAIALIFIIPNGFEEALMVLVHEADVFIFLFGMFVIVTALELSGYLNKGAKLFLNFTKTGKHILLIIVLVFGLSASFLINDTVAILAPILLIIFAKQINRNSKPFILAVAYAITFGSALLPTGNPQNFILAKAGGISFLSFALWALFPTIFSLFCCYFVIRFFYRSDFSDQPIEVTPFILERYEDEKIGKPALIALGLIFVGLIMSSFFQFSMAFVFLVVTGIFLFLRNERDKILSKLDWGIFFFFGGMFVVINYVTSSKFFAGVVTDLMNEAEFNFTTFCIFILIIFVSSQFLSNVPVAIVVASLLPGTILDHPLFWMGAALSSTFAGATTILGAASNIIVIETVKKKGLTITWLEFAKIGIVVSLLCLISVFLLGGVYFLLLH